MKSVIVPNLTGSRQEVTSVAGLIKGDSHLLLRTEATETAFKALPLADFRIIHLAVHGVADTHFPDRAALVLGSSSSGEDDGGGEKLGHFGGVIRAIHVVGQ